MVVRISLASAGTLVCKFDLADLEVVLAGVRHLRMLADEAGFVSSQVHVSFTHCSTSSAVTVTVGVCLGSEATLQLVAVFFGHGVGFAGGHVSALMSVTWNFQNSSTPSRRTSKRSEPDHASDCVGSTLGHAV